MTHLQVDTSSVNCEFKNATSIELIDVNLKDNLPPNINENNNQIFWVVRESDSTNTNGITEFPVGFWTLEDIQTALNNDLKYKGCSISFQFKYNENIKKITLFKVKPMGCKIDVFLLGNSLMKLIGFSTDWIVKFPSSNNEDIRLFPYGNYRLECSILDPNKNLVNGEPSKLLCYLNYPFNYSVKKATINRFSQINFNVYNSNNIQQNFFTFFCFINGE